MLARKLTIAGGLAGLALSLQGCPDQPEQDCTIGRGPFAAKYTLVESTRLEGTGDCPVQLGDLIGVEQYFPATPDKTQDINHSTVALKAYHMGILADQWVINQPYPRTDADPTHKVYALGPMVSQKPSGGFCRLGAMSPAELVLAEVPPTGTPPDDGGGVPEAGTGDEGGAPDGGTQDASVSDDGATPDAGAEDAGVEEAPPPPPFDPGTPAVNMKYEWSNVRFLTRPETPGEAFGADLTVTENGCRTTYKVRAEFYNRGFELSAGAGNGHDLPLPKLCATADENGNVTPNPALCSSDPDPAHGAFKGSGINPIFQKHIVCDPQLLLCVLDTDVENL